MMFLRDASAAAFDLRDYSLLALHERWRDGDESLFDAHCHVSFASNAEDVARELTACSVGCFSNTVTPSEYLDASVRLEPWSKVSVGLGLHPWWLLDGRCGLDDAELFEALVGKCSFVGEIGLDFGRKFKESSESCKTAMVDAFERVVDACVRDDGVSRVISIHSVRSAGAVLDVLERTECAKKHKCILHWFSGTSDELQRAIKLGCWFSVGKSMLEQKKGRAYVQAIPADRLLLETDAPSDPIEGFDAGLQIANLRSAFDLLLALKGLET